MLSSSIDSLNTDCLLYLCRNFFSDRQLKPLALVNKRFQYIVALHLYRGVYCPLDRFSRGVPGLVCTVDLIDWSSNAQVGQVARAIEQLETQMLERLEKIPSTHLKAFQDHDLFGNKIIRKLCDAAEELYEASEKPSTLQEKKFRQTLCLASHCFFHYMQKLNLTVNFECVTDNENLKTRIAQYLSGGYLKRAAYLCVHHSKLRHSEYMLPIIEGYIETCLFEEALSSLRRLTRDIDYEQHVQELVIKLLRQHSYLQAATFFSELAPNLYREALIKIFIALDREAISYDFTRIIRTLPLHERELFNFWLALLRAFDVWESKDRSEEEKYSVGQALAEFRVNPAGVLKQYVRLNRENELVLYFTYTEYDALVLAPIMEEAFHTHWPLADKLIEFEKDESSLKVFSARLAKISTKPLPKDD